MGEKLKIALDERPDIIEAAGSRGRDSELGETSFAWPVCWSTWFELNILNITLATPRLVYSECPIFQPEPRINLIRCQRLILAIWRINARTWWN